MKYFCIKCGKPTAADAGIKPKFCSFCGNSFDATISRATSSPTVIKYHVSEEAFEDSEESDFEREERPRSYGRQPRSSKLKASIDWGDESPSLEKDSGGSRVIGGGSSLGSIISQPRGEQTQRTVGTPVQRDKDFLSRVAEEYKLDRCRPAKIEEID